MQEPVIIVGAGPAGLTAAYALVKRQARPIVLEKADRVGGIARTEVYRGYRFDIGGHRFFTKVPEVNALWHEVLGQDFLRVSRLSRIYFNGRFLNYPLEPFNALSNLGVYECSRLLLSYVRWQIRPAPVEETFEQWVHNRFGGRLYWRFFKTYTEKVWGIPCDKIQADWAAQRIKGLDLKKALLNAFLGVGEEKTLIREFEYPRLGPGMMWERFQSLVEKGGGRVQLGADVIRFNRDDRRIRCVAAHVAGATTEFAGAQFISSMAVSGLIARLDPPAPLEVQAAARGLSYRDLIVVGLIVNRDRLFPDNWIYIHSPEVKVGRIQNFKNWSSSMVADPTQTCLGLEYFCSVGDAIWSMRDDELIALARQELAQLGLAAAADVADGVVLRQRQAYPVYDSGYRERVAAIRSYLAGFENLQTIGRNGMHRYNNQDHSMLTGLLAVRNLGGDHHDLWDVNTERSYYEDFTVASATT